MKTAQAAPLASVAELADYGAINFGTATRLGNIGRTEAQLSRPDRPAVDTRRVDRQGGPRVRQRRHATWRPRDDDHDLPHDYAAPLNGDSGIALFRNALMDNCEVGGGSPYGATTIAGPDGSRQPSAGELAMAHVQGAHVARIAARRQIERSARRAVSARSRPHHGVFTRRPQRRAKATSRCSCNRHDCAAAKIA
jgi:NAD(P)H dehydrogenase (quinone)